MPSPTATFNPAAALPDYLGGNSYVIKAGDSVSSIATKMGMGVEEFKNYLKGQYGEGADLNSIVAGRSLPIPADRLAAYKEANSNGLDLPSPQAPAPDSHDPTDPRSAGAINGHDHQSDNYLNLAEIPEPELANLLVGRASGAYGAGQLGPFDILPLNENSSLLVNADGDITGEINRLPNGDLRIKNVAGESLFVNASGAVLTPAQYSLAQLPNPASAGGYVNGADLQSDLAAAAIADTQAALQAAGALGLINTLIGLQNWSQQSDLSHASTVVAIYNQLNSLSSGTLGNSSGLGNLGQLGAGLGFLSALESGNAGGIVANGVALGNAVFDNAVSKAIGGALGMNAANVMPGIGLIIALDSGDPLSVVSAALAFIPGWGQVAAAVLSILGGMFEDDIPMKEGKAQANWDAAGNVHVSTTQDIEGGGASASGWMNGIVHGLQNQLASQLDPNGGPVYSLVPQRLPSIGYQYDPDGMNYASAEGHLYLQWVDANGAEQTRYYDGAGNRGDGTGETLAGDFMRLAADAIVPTWEAQTMLAHWQETRATQGLDAANAEARQAAASGLPQEAADQLTQVLSALTFEVTTLATSAGPVAGLIDIDGDGYLEQTQWVAANEALLTIDLNGDGVVSAGEVLNINGAGTARNTLSWLDANHDGKLDASDPAFAALRVWLDTNSDGQSQSAELQGASASLMTAAITAIDFGANPPTLVRADGTRTALTQQQLTGDVLGVAYAATVGGLLESKERGETVLHAVNTRAFDGDAAHVQGGNVDTDGFADSEGRPANGPPVLINAIDARLSTTTTRTLANPLGFVPAGAASLSQAQRQATEAMVRSASSGLFGAPDGAGLSMSALAAVAVGAAAVQWPTMAAADSLDALGGQVPTPPLAPAVGDTLPTLNGAASTDLAAQTTQAVQSDPARIDLSSLQIGRVIANVHPASSVEAQPASDFYASNQAPAQSGQAPTAINSGANAALPPNSATEGSGSLTATLLGSGAGGVGADLLLTYPQVAGELIAGTEDIGLRITAASLLANDSTLNSGDPSRPMLSISAVSQPVHGQVALRINEAGQTEVVFIPEANYYGGASFNYTVTDQYGLSTVATASLVLTSVNDAPDARGEAASGDEDNTLMFNAADLLANDSDVDSMRDGDVLRITRVGLAEHGMVFLDASGQIRFVPDANYNGPAQFTYWVGDRSEADMAAANGGGVGLESPATMRLTVLPVNDLPVVTGESIASDEDVVLTIAQSLLLANDSDVDVATNGQVLTISAVSGAQHGTVALLPDGSIQFTPEQDYFGPASFVYTVDDGNGGQVQTTAVVNLASVNDVPVVNDELLMGKRDATYTLSQAALLANDTDLEAPDNLSIVAVQGMSHGTAVLNANGSVTFAPEPGYAGRGRFEYVVQDADGGQAVAVTEIDFAAININPVATNDSFIGFEDTAFTIQPGQLLVNDSDPDAGALSSLVVGAVRSATNGTVSLQGDGSVRFNPAANFYGTASFQYQANDGEGGQTWATAYLNVQSVNDAPVIEDIWYGTPIYGYEWQTYQGEYAPYTILQATSNEAHARGLLAAGQLCNSAGQVIAASYYTNGQLRPVGFDLIDSTVTVAPSSLENGELTYFLQNDPYRQNGRVIAYDPDGDSAAITISIGGGPQHGHAWTNVVVPNSSPAFLTHDVASGYFVSATGAWQYFSHYADPYTGSDPFTITATDGQGASTTAMVYAAHQGSSAGGGGKCPIVMDLNGDGIELIRPEDSNIFADINGDGWRERIGWAAAEDGVLTFDANGDGKITDNAEVSFVGYKAGAQTDLDGLAAFDTDGDGKLTAGDADWSKFGVLRDANGNGLQDEGELVALDQLGITVIGLQRHGLPSMNQGNVVFGTAAVEFADGHVGVAGDVMFAGENIPLLQAALDALQDAEVARLALLMSQYGAQAQGQTEPLGYVYWAEVSQAQASAADMSGALAQGEQFGADVSAAAETRG